MRLARLYWLIAALGAAGSVAAFSVRGWGYGLGFAFGAVGAGLNVYWLSALMNAIGPGGEAPKGARAAFLMLRYAVLFLCAYVILKIFGVSPVSILLGLLTASFAVILETLFQLFYART